MQQTGSSVRIVLLSLAAMLGIAGCGYVGAAVARQVLTTDDDDDPIADPGAPPPIVTGVTPGTGTAFGGETVTITGSQFQSGATVVFGFLQATNVAVASEFIIECRTPGFAPGQVPVIVHNPDGKTGTLNNGYIYLGPTPAITGVAPGAGAVAGGTAITLTGTNFSPNATVTVGGTAATSVVVSSATQLTAVTPAGTLGPADVEITNVDLQTAVLTGGFTYQGVAPTVSAVNPASGPPGGGTLITITGTGFLSGASVEVGGAPATGVTVVSGTSITATTPSGSGMAGVTVTNIDLQSGTLPNAFTYSGTGATVTAVNPALGPTGGSTLVTITGSNFATGASITIGGAAVASPTFVDSNTYTALTPTGTAGPANVVVTNVSAPPGTLVNGFTFQGAAPTLSNVNPGAGPLAGGTLVTVTGTNFVAGATLEFGGVQATGVTVVSGTSITCTTPAGAIGPATLDLYNGDLQTATLASAYIYQAAPPTLTGVNPGAGPLGGGTPITLTGTNFFGGATVDIGGSPAASVVVVSGSTITCTTPSGTQGPANVQVTNVDLQSASLAGGYIFQGAAPTVTSVQAPAAGPLAGGTTITVVGTNFVANATVTVGGNPATSVVVQSGTSIECVTPAGPIGPATVEVTNVDLLSGSLASAYTYQGPTPTVGSVVPNTGPLGGGTFVTVNGTNFAAGATVTFGGSQATGVTVLSATQITCVTPSGSGAVNVVVTNVDTLFGTLAGGFSYSGTAATVTSVNPAVGPTGGSTLVTITGTNFVAGATVLIGTNQATGVSVVTATQITCTTATGTQGPANVTVTNPSASPATLVNGFTYQGAVPTVTNVTPGAGPLAGGTFVTVTGTNFVAGATVEFGGVQATGVTVVSGTQITCTTPSGAIGPATVDVHNIDLQSASLPSGYVFQGAAPTLTSVNPGNGPLAGGTAITLTGTNFVAGATVTVGGGNATSVTVVSGSTITCTTPSGSQGPAGVVVTNVDLQNAALAGGFVFEGPAPTLTNVNPGAGPLAGGTFVTLTGTNFVAGATVTFGTGSATGVTVVSGTQITCTTPSGTIGPANVTVTNVDLLSATLPSGYTFQGGTPTVSSVTPNSGPLGGGTFVTVTGTNFFAGATVDFGGSLATGVTVVSGTQITCTTPSGAGPVTVTVTNVDTLSGALPAGFTYAGTSATVSSITPATGPVAGGTPCSITGSNFVTGATVAIGAGTATGVTVVSGTLITCTTPSGSAGPANVEVTNPFSPPGTLVGGYTYLGPPPTLGSVTPSTGPTAGGTAVTLTGTNFVGGASVTFGVNAATSVVVVSGTSITCVTPAGAAGPVAVTVTNPDTQQATQPTGFSYSSGGPPTVSSVSPSIGPAAGGSPVTITGSNFLSGATVDFGGMPATNVVVGSGNLITATVPPHQPAVVRVTVTNTDGQSGFLNSAYTFQGPPTLGSVVPGSGSTAGGTRIVVYGTGFAAGATVSVNGIQAFQTVVSLDGTRISAVTPPGGAGSVGVMVTNPAGTPTTGGQSAGLANAFTYVTAGTDPTIGLLSPAVGPPAGGTTVTITGNGFSISGITNVAFGSKPGGSVSVIDANTLTVVTPSNATGPYAVAVINPNGLSVTKLDAFTYEAGTTPPSFAGLTQARALGGRSIELNWPAASDAGTPASKMRYEIHAATSSGGQKFSTPDFVTDPGVTRFTVGGCAPGTTYYFVVRAVDELGNGDSNSVERSATTSSVLAPAPWPADGALNGARRRHTATLLADGRVLVAGGDGGSGSIASAEIYDPARGRWVTTGSMATPREGHTAVLLSNGQVLVAGGLNASGPATPLASCELWNPATGTWSGTTGPMSSARMDHTATLLRDGRVLVAGGDNFGVLNTAEFYTVSTGTWSSTNNTIGTARSRHTATLLGDGRVLIAGGDNSGAIANCGVYDPAFNTWANTSSLNGARRRHTAVRLRNGFVLVAGGENSGPLATTELYDPGKSTWTAAASMGAARESHTATLLPDGRLVVASGRAAALLNTAETYDPVADSWASAGTIGLNGRMDHTATMLPTGRVLVAGGDTGAAVTNAFRFDPARGAGTWYGVGALAEPRANHNALLLPDGRVLVVAGDASGTPLTDAELFDPEKQSWVAGGTDTTQRTLRGAVLLATGRVLLATGDRGSGSSTDCTLYRPDAGSFSAAAGAGTSRSEPTAVLLRTGRVLLMGGYAGVTSLDAVERYDPAAGTWTTRNKMADARRRFTATVLDDGKVLAAGGENLAALNRAELYDPVGGTWTATFGPLSSARRHHTATLLPGGRVLIAAGHNTGYLASAELYDPVAATFSTTGSLGAARRDHTATLLADGGALVVGGRNTLNRLGSAELYDPASGSWSGTGSLAAQREGHTATLLPDGRVLVAGGLGSAVLGSCELFDPGKGFADNWRPLITAVHGNSTFPAVLPYSTNITIDGARLRGLSEGGGGGRNDSSGDVPVVTLVGPLGGEGGRAQSGPGRTIVVPATTFAGGTALIFRTPPSTAMGKGHYLLRVVVNGVPSIARIVKLP